jgi:hypothetical protein
MDGGVISYNQPVGSEEEVEQRENYDGEDHEERYFQFSLSFVPFDQTKMVSL